MELASISVSIGDIDEWKWYCMDHWFHSNAQAHTHPSILIGRVCAIYHFSRCPIFAFNGTARLEINVFIWNIILSIHYSIFIERLPLAWNLDAAAAHPILYNGHNGRHTSLLEYTSDALFFLSFSSSAAISPSPLSSLSFRPTSAIAQRDAIGAYPYPNIDWKIDENDEWLQIIMINNWIDLLLFLLLRHTFFFTEFPE